MIRVDILSPVGGKVGGIENVIKLWTKNLSQPDYVVRVIHMSPGTKYLDGYTHMHSVIRKMKILMKSLKDL